MKSTPFDKLVDKTSKMLDRYATASIYDSCKYLRIYLRCLSLHGWTELEFNKELLRRIDLEWDRIINPFKFLN